MKVTSKQGHNGQFGKFAPGEYDLSLAENDHVKRAHAKFPHTFDVVDDEAALVAETVAAVLTPQPGDLIAKPEVVEPGQKNPAKVIAPKPKAKAKRKPSGKAVTPG